MDPVSITLTAVGWLMTALVEKAVTGLLEAWAKRTGLGDDFKTLNHQLLQTGSLLTSTRGIRTDNSFLEELVQELQQLAYQAENLLDELDYYRLEDKIQQGGAQEKVNCSNKSSVASYSSGFRLASRSILSTLKGMSCCSAQSDVQGCENRINLSQRMKDLVEQLQKSEMKVRNAVQIEALVKPVWNTETSTSEATNIWQTSSFLTEPIVFGRDQELGRLMNILTNKETVKVGKVPVLAIVGSGGVGKTTLARRVFNDPKVHSYFEVRSWICVSTQFDCVKLTREMLEGACGTRCDLTNLNELQNKLKNELGSKRFLLVLDNMWEDKDKSQWDSMVAPLNNCMGNESIILVTTRNQNVAKMIDAGDNIIHLKGLDENAFLSFFSTCIFNDTNYGGNWRLRNIGQQIANKLKGNPLAAKTVSALLKENCDERYWIEIRDSEEWKTQSGSNHIMPALRLSYEYMPFHLQRCFSYCAIFPEDHPFTCEELVYLWMAQGYLDASSEGKRMEDIGRAYFNDLLNRGFFQTVQLTYTNEVHYTFHDLIHNLACAVSFKECFSINGAITKEIPQTIRHFSIFNSIEKAESEKIVTALAGLEGENLGTIFIWDELPSRISHISHISRSIWDLVKKTKFLRVMKLDSQVQLHNYKFQNFVSLRYLKLIMSSNQKTLPREICRLYHLEVLEIRYGWYLDELPNNFNDLVSLRHFIIIDKPSVHSKICGAGKLTSLQELNHFEVQQKKGFEIEQLGSLKEIGGSLHISKLENVKSDGEASKARLAEKGKLDALYLNWNHGEKENESVLEDLKPNTNLKLLNIYGYGGVASPKWLDTSLIFLESLTLWNCKAWELLPPIGEFEFLKQLKLCRLPLREIGPQCYGTRQSMKFQSLEELEITYMPDLEKWVWSDQIQQFQCFKKLIKLTIRNCKAWELLPPIGELESLKYLKLSKLPVREIGPQCYGTCQSIKFQSLEELEITDMPDLEKWVWSDQLQQFQCLKKLIKLTIRNCKAWELLPPIGEFESLKHLKLSQLPVREIGLHCYGTRQSMIFQSLEELEITDMPNLEKWVWSDQLQQFLCFKKLKKLTIRDCPKLVDLPLSGSTSKVLERFPSLESLKMVQSSSLKMGELLAFHEHSSLRYLDISHISSMESFHENLVIPYLKLLRISHISSLESLDLHSFVALEELKIRECQSLTSLTFGEHLVYLKTLKIVSCKALSSMKGLKSCVNLQRIEFRECPGFIATWDSASKETERTEPDFSLSLTEIQGNSLSLLTLPICKQLTSLRIFQLEVSAFTEEDEVSPQLLTSINLVDIEGCKKNLESFPFDLFPSLRVLQIKFPHIQSLTTDSHNEITEECVKLRNIKEVRILGHPLQIWFELS